MEYNKGDNFVLSKEPDILQHGIIITRLVSNVLAAGARNYYLACIPTMMTFYPPHTGEYNKSFAITGTCSSVCVRTLVPSLAKTSDTVEDEKLVGGQKTTSPIARVDPKMPGININGLSTIYFFIADKGKLTYISLFRNACGCTITFKSGIEDSNNNDGNTRIEVYTSNHPVLAFYELLLVDINMPDMNGFQLCEKILAIHIIVRICFMSSGEINREELRYASDTRGS